MMICYLLVEACLAASTGKSLGELRANYQRKLAIATQQLDWYNKHWPTAQGSVSWVLVRKNSLKHDWYNKHCWTAEGSASSVWVPKEVITLKQEVAWYRDRITYYTE